MIKFCITDYKPPSMTNGGLISTDVKYLYDAKCVGYHESDLLLFTKYNPSSEFITSDNLDFILRYKNIYVFNSPELIKKFAEKTTIDEIRFDCKDISKYDKLISDIRSIDNYRYRVDLLTSNNNRTVRIYRPKEV